MKSELEKTGKNIIEDLISTYTSMVVLFLLKPLAFISMPPPMGSFRAGVRPYL